MVVVVFITFSQVHYLHFDFGASMLLVKGGGETQYINSNCFVVLRIL